MIIELTDEQWAGISQQSDAPVKVGHPSHRESFVLLRADVYERFQALFEDTPLSDQERLFRLKQFGLRAGWDDPAMNVYDDLDPRKKT